MYVHPETMLKTILHNIHETLPYITAYVSYAPNTVHLQLDIVRQNTQENTYDYLINITTPNTNILDTADKTINYTAAFLQDYNYYPEPLNTPNSQLYYPYSL